MISDGELESCIELFRKTAELYGNGGKLTKEAFGKLLPTKNVSNYDKLFQAHYLCLPDITFN